MSRLEQLNALLPQTQCKECGYAGCKPYAAAMAEGCAPIDKCPPGGVAVLQALAHSLSVDPSPYLSKALALYRPPSTAHIREAECIGCTKCIQACPVDAILGTAKHMHQVLPDECTGCGLCVEPCPVDCIDIIEQPTALFDKQRSQARFENRQKRLALHTNDPTPTADISTKKTYIQEALLRVQKKHE